MAKKDMLKGMLCNLIFALIPFSSGRAKFIKKHNILDMCGENLFFQPRSLPTDPKCVRFHNDVVIAADVKFICHDVIYLNMRRCGYSDAKQHLGCIEVMDNAFIGAKAIVLPNVRIGKNAIVAAGSIVNKDVDPFPKKRTQSRIKKPNKMQR